MRALLKDKDMRKRISYCKHKGLLNNVQRTLYYIVKCDKNNYLLSYKCSKLRISSHKYK